MTSADRTHHSPKINTWTPPCGSLGGEHHLRTEFVPMAPIAVAPYLQAYGFAAVDFKTWRVSPGSSSSSDAPSPVVQVHVDGHKEVDGHTLYSLTCSLVGGSINAKWKEQRRLQQLRDDLHDAVKVELGDLYSQHFGSTPFAHKGGLIGTTARLHGWFRTLARCINTGRTPPSIAALVLSFLDAPEGMLDTVPAQSCQKGFMTPTTQSWSSRSNSSQDTSSNTPKSESRDLDGIEWKPDALPAQSWPKGLLMPTAQSWSSRSSSSKDTWPDTPKSGSTDLDDIELCLTVDLDDIVLDEGLLPSP